MTPEQLARLPGVLFEIGKVIGSDNDPGPQLSRVSELICTLLDADACSVMLLDGERRRLLAKAAYGLRSERMHKLSFAVGEGVAGWVAANVEAAVIDDVSVDPRFVVLEEPRTPIVAMLSVPLVARGDCVGVVTATSSRPAAFRSHDVELLRFIATTIALDVENIRLHRVAVTDPLTGAFNREFLQQRLPLELEVATQRDQPLSLAMVDVDHFKAVNDSYGHDVGDEVLAEIARRLRSAIRTDDLLVRYGGEEFLVVLPRADAGKGWEVGERMRLRVGTESIAVDGQLLDVKVSIGIAQHRVPTRASADDTMTQAETTSELIRRADTALYAAKAAGRNRVEVSP